MNKLYIALGLVTKRGRSIGGGPRPRSFCGGGDCGARRAGTGTRLILATLALALGGISASCGNDSSGPPSSGQGSEGHDCYGNATCDTGLACLSELCVRLQEAGAGGGATGGGGTGRGGSTHVGGTTGIAGASGSGGTSRDSGAGGTTSASGGTSGGAAGAPQGGSGGRIDAGVGDAAPDGAAGCPPIESYGPLSYDNNNSRAWLYLGAPPNEEFVAWSGAKANALFVGYPLAVELHNNEGPFGTSITAKSIDLSTQALYKTCGACVLLGDSRFDPYIATSGTLVITAAPAFPTSALGQTLSATLSNVTFEHVHIDMNTFDQTKVDDCKVTVSSAAIRSVLVVPPMCSSNADCSEPMPTCTGVFCGG